MRLNDNRTAEAVRFWDTGFLKARPATGEQIATVEPWRPARERGAW